VVLITIKKLQREFGLSHVTAAGIIGEQRSLAWKRYRMLSALSSCGWLIFVGFTFADTRFPHGVLCWIPFVMLALMLFQHYLITRASREPILAAARARQPRGNACPQATV
jgi:hypothetical protein